MPQRTYGVKDKGGRPVVVRSGCAAGQGPYSMGKLCSDPSTSRALHVLAPSWDMTS